MDQTSSSVRAKSFGLIANPTKPGARELALALRDQFANHGWTALTDKVTAALLGSTAVHGYEEIGREAEVVVVLGGDGTILTTAQLLGRHIKPLAAVNTGRLGFLTTAAADDQDRFVHAIVTGHYRLSRRRLLEVEYTGRNGDACSAHALNELSITRGSLPRMIHIEARIDGELFNHYNGDGLIVATPTGSTAYSLSAGGPIVSPDANVILLTPICSHALANRSLVVDDRAVLEFSAHGASTDVLLTLDGHDSENLARETSVRVRRANFDIPLVTLPGHSFYALLQRKLGWSGSTL
jgi:NAD+ kinase